MGSVPLDLTGQVFGLLTALVRTDPSKFGWLWYCICTCGGQTYVPAGRLTSGESKSCGCARGNNAKHGLYKSVEYKIWGNMKSRTSNPRDPNYMRYGGRGIGLYPPWSDFMAFYDHLQQTIGLRPRPGLSLDRIDNDGNYEPGNLKWSTHKEQMNNSRTVHYLEHDGQRLTIHEWGERVGINETLISYRLSTLHWSVDRALTEKVNHKYAHK